MAVPDLWPRQMRFQQRRRVRVVNVRHVIVVASRDGRGPDLPVIYPNAGQGTDDLRAQRVAVPLHLERLPLDDGHHRPLHACLLPHDAVNLAWVAVAEQ
jgi:hypothetical protein